MIECFEFISINCQVPECAVRGSRPRKSENQYFPPSPSQPSKRKRIYWNTYNSAIRRELRQNSESASRRTRTRLGSVHTHEISLCTICKERLENDPASLAYDMDKNRTLGTRPQQCFVDQNSCLYMYKDLI